jgi:hypothetical protein
MCLCYFTQTFAWLSLGGAQVRNHSSLPAFPKIPNLVWVLKKKSGSQLYCNIQDFSGKKKTKISGFF